MAWIPELSNDKFWGSFEVVIDDNFAFDLLVSSHLVPGTVKSQYSLLVPELQGEDYVLVLQMEIIELLIFG